MSKKGISGLTILITIAMLAALGGGYVIMKNQGLLSTSGFATLSLTKVDYSSNDATLAGPAFLLTVVQNGKGQYATGTFSDLSDSGAKNQKPITITLEDGTQSCDYTIQSTNNNIRTLTITDSGSCLACTASKKNDCLAKGGIWAADKAIKQNYICAQWENAGIIGNVITDKLSFNTVISATIDSTTYKASISNNGANSVTLSQGRVYASWEGNLNSGLSCPSPSERAISAIYNSGWTTVDKEAVTKYQLMADDFYDTCLANVASGTDKTRTFQNCVEEVNDAATLARQPKNLEYLGTSGKTTGDTKAGTVKIPLNDQIQFPVFTMRVRADLLGIYLPVGKPVITNAKSDCFQTGSNGNAVITILNEGTARGTFKVSTVCAGSFSTTGNTKTIQVNPSQSVNVNVGLVADSGSTTKKEDCRVTVTDVENPENKDSTSFTACAKPLLTCTEGSLRCTGDVQERCTGGAWTIITGSQECVEKIVEPDKNLDPETVKLIAFVTLLVIAVILTSIGMNKEGGARIILFAIGGLAMIGAIIIGFKLFTAFSMIIMTLGLAMIITGSFLIYSGGARSGLILMIGIVLFIIGLGLGLWRLEATEQHKTLLQRIFNW